MNSAIALTCRLSWATPTLSCCQAPGRWLGVDAAAEFDPAQFDRGETNEALSGLAGAAEALTRRRPPGDAGLKWERMASQREFVLVVRDATATE